MNTCALPSAAPRFCGRVLRCKRLPATAPESSTHFRHPATCKFYWHSTAVCSPPCCYAFDPLVTHVWKKVKPTCLNLVEPTLRCPCERCKVGSTWVHPTLIVPMCWSSQCTSSTTLHERSHNLLHTHNTPIHHDSLSTLKTQSSSVELWSPWDLMFKSWSYSSASCYPQESPKPIFNITMSLCDSIHIYSLAPKFIICTSTLKHWSLQWRRTRNTEHVFELLELFLSWNGKDGQDDCR